MQRLKVPPPIHQFSRVLERNQGILLGQSIKLFLAKTLFDLLKKYSPESQKEKAERLQKEGERRIEGISYSTLL